MLQRLIIQNYALIQHITIDFDQGLTVITGETGAGKTILMGALSLIMGQRADSKVIKEGATKCLVEAEYRFEDDSLELFFKANELDYFRDSCIVRREILSNGKSRSFINDTPVSLAQLKELTSQLTDIHSQHQNLLIGSDQFQLDVLDAVADNQLIRHDYAASFKTYVSLQSSLKKMIEASEQAGKEADYIRFQYTQLNEAHLKADEQEALDEEWQMLSHAEDIKVGLAAIQHWLDQDDTGIIHQLRLSVNQAESLNRHFPKMGAYAERLKTAYIELKDIASDVGVFFTDVTVDPLRMQQVNDRINFLYSLQQKHRVSTVSELIALRDDYFNQMAEIEQSDEKIADLQQQLRQAAATTQSLAEQLTASRKAVLKKLEASIIVLLQQLGIPNARFEVSLEPKNKEADGQDNVRFLFSANKNASLQPIETIASGGEISRIMLSVKAILADQSQVSTLIFDEIDTGVSGEVAHKMGGIMQRIATNRQVICITHLPQIAAQGKHHFKVIKTEHQDESLTVVKALDEDERLTEISQMLSGAHITEAARQNARTLLNERKN